MSITCLSVLQIILKTTVQADSGIMCHTRCSLSQVCWQTVYSRTNLTDRQDSDGPHEEIPLSFDTSSAEAWQKAMTWLSRCLHDHVTCNETSKFPWYPTRLICVSSNQTAAGRVRLVCTADQRPDGPYVTLSHCWGQLQILRLLRTNIDEFRSGISFTKLPRTFQEAVTIAQRLGISWIWIDSLCTSILHLDSPWIIG
jgi:hypothetical protein